MTDSLAVTLPKRIQRKRTKGWRMPEGVVYVGRGTQWGHPFKAGPKCDAKCRAQIVERYRREITNYNGGVVGFNVLWARRHLRGKDLACWCPLDQPCHADVLLEVANA